MGASVATPDFIDDETEAMLKRADEALDGLRDSFSVEAASQIGRMETALADLSGDPDSLDDERRQDLFEAIFESSHEIKGQAGSFGYDLLTHVCDSLCHVIEGRDLLPGDPVDAIRHHLHATRLIFDQDLKGDGGSTGAALLGELGRIKAYLSAAAEAPAAQG